MCANLCTQNHSTGSCGCYCEIIEVFVHACLLALTQELLSFAVMTESQGRLLCATEVVHPSGQGICIFLLPVIGRTLLLGAQS